MKFTVITIKTKVLLPKTYVIVADSGCPPYVFVVFLLPKTYFFGVLPIIPSVLFQKCGVPTNLYLYLCIY